jgi:hypothetical protein
MPFTAPASSSNAVLMGFWIKSSQATEPYGLSRRHGA